MILYALFYCWIVVLIHRIRFHCKIIQLHLNGIYPSYKLEEYRSFADGLYNAMNHDWFTYENIISIHFDCLKNDADIIVLSRVFQVKYGESLNQCLKDELLPGSIIKINLSLQNKGITQIIR